MVLSKLFSPNFYRYSSRRQYRVDAPDREVAAVQALLQDGLQGMALTDMEGAISYVSPSTSRFLDYCPGDLIGANAADLIHSEDRERVLEQTSRELIRPNSTTTLQCRCRHQDGSWRWLEVSLTNRLHNPEVQAIVIVYRDISEAVERDTALREEHSLLHAVVESTTDAVFAKDLEGRYTIMNPAGAQLLGKSVEEIIGRKTSDVFSSDTAQSVMDVDEQVIASGEARTFEYTATAAGVTRTYRSSRGPHRDARGRIVGVVGISRDVTSLKQAEQALQKAHEDLRAIVEAAPVAIIALDLEGRITTWNPAAERIFGWNEEESLGKLPAFIPDCGEKTYLQRLYRAVDERVFTVQEVRRLRKDGTEMDAGLSIAALRNDSGEVTGFMAVLMDITQRKQAEAALVALNTELEDRVTERTAQLQAANHELEAFSYSVSHDLMNPLTIISGNAHLLLHFYGDSLDTPGRNLLERILTTGERMSGLIGALLSLARMSHTNLHRETLQLDQLCHGIIEGLQILDPRPNINVEIQPGITAEGDPRLVAAVLDNLLRNAWKFTRHCPAGQIQVGATLQQNETVYYVRDNGVGFEPEHVNQLFNAFGRLHTTSEFEGSGIGLATVARIIRRHRGRIWAEGKVDQGATFYFTL